MTVSRFSSISAVHAAVPPECVAGAEFIAVAKIRSTNLASQMRGRVLEHRLKHRRDVARRA